MLCPSLIIFLLSVFIIVAFVITFGLSIYSALRVLFPTTEANAVHRLLFFGTILAIPESNLFNKSLLFLKKTY